MIMAFIATSILVQATNFAWTSSFFDLSFFMLYLHALNASLVGTLNGNLTCRTGYLSKASGVTVASDSNWHSWSYKLCILVSWVCIRLASLSVD